MKILDFHDIRYAWGRIRETQAYVDSIDRNQIGIEEIILDADAEVDAAWQDYLEVLINYIRQEFPA